MQNDNQNIEADFDDVGNRGNAHRFELSQGNSKGQGQEDDRQDLSFVTERPQDALGHLIEDLTDEISLLDLRCNTGGSFGHLRPAPGLQRVRDQQPQQNCHHRVDDEQPGQAKTGPLRQAGVHKCLQNGEKNHRSGQRT